MSKVALTVNDRWLEASAEPRTSLADFVREELDLTGTHLGCEHGVCGACTVLLDGVPARSCITCAVACDGAAVTTIEGLDEDEITTELRVAFTREHALQCGYCTPGMLVSSRDLVLRLPNPDEKQIRIGLSGNLCRCTGYAGIVRAVSSVIEQRRRRGVAPQRDGGRKTLGPAGSGRSKQAGADWSGGGQPLRRPQETTVPVNLISDFTPAHHLQQYFDVAHPPDRVFAMLGDVASVAACLPGVTLLAPPSPDRVDGVISVKIGPVAAKFRGAARVERNPAELSGRIIGIGTDERSRSSTRGEVHYHLIALDGGRTRVDISLGYTLTGFLAQLGRPALVRDLASRLTADFAANLDRLLSGAPLLHNTAAPADLNAFSLVWNVVRARLTQWFARRPKRDDGAVS